MREGGEDEVLVGWRYLTLGSAAHASAPQTGECKKSLWAHPETEPKTTRSVRKPSAVVFSEQRAKEYGEISKST